MDKPVFPDAREPLPHPIISSELVYGDFCEFCGKPADNWPGDIGQLFQMCWEAECARTWGMQTDKLGVLVEPDLDGPGSYLVALL